MSRCCARDDAGGSDEQPAKPQEASLVSARAIVFPVQPVPLPIFGSVFEGVFTEFTVFTVSLLK